MATPLIHEDFLLRSTVAKRLYHHYAKEQPIFDFHCHLSPQEILEDRTYENLTQLWLSGDHYKWRLMRAHGVEEALITGDGDPYDKFLAWAKTVEQSMGNPLYHWTHMELKTYFGVDHLLGEETAREIYTHCAKKLREPGFSARGFIVRSGVEALCTTDDPIDDLHCHRALAEDSSFPVQVLPAFRPEIALHPENSNFCGWVEKLGTCCGISITTWENLETALEQRAEFFRDNGCLIADQSLLSPDFTSIAPAEQAHQALEKALRGEVLTPGELNTYQVHLLLFLGRLYHRMGFAMQLHFGVLRNCNSRLFPSVGADGGFDAVGDGISAASVAKLLDGLDQDNQLPPTVVYSLNGGDDDKLASVLGCFQQGGYRPGAQLPPKLQLGAPWWFSDHRDGMVKQMKALANTGLLSGFIGMLTDSRSFLSYVRHDYFRRVLCNLLGEWMEAGELPGEERAVGQMVERICYENSVQYFGLSQKKKG